MTTITSIKTEQQELVGYWTKLAVQRIESQLPNHLPIQSEPPIAFNSAMHYVMGLAGKRIRPTLVYLTGHMIGASLEACDSPALAVELIHTYSLVHDDLPAMDDDDLRRGKPSCHKAYDEATAILVGDALQTLAFEVLSKPSEVLTAQQQMRMIQVLSQASGAQGMCRGQALDVEASGQSLEVEQLKLMHRCKTGALIKASILMGALSYQSIPDKVLELLANFADHVGLAFQVQDDILDITGDTTTLGKPQGSDLALGKATYPSLLGLEQAKEYARKLCEQAKSLLNRLDYDVQPLSHLADYIVNRVA